MRVLLVNYHKTGAALVLELMRLLHDYHAGITPGHVAQAFRQRCATRLPSELTACRADVVRWSSPELVCSANLTCYTSVVHLLRDPARWAISAYDFHRKSPPTEEWVTKSQDLCAPSQAQLYAESLLGDDGLAAARRACAALVNGAAGGVFSGLLGGGSRRSLYDLLHTLPERDGIRLMALFGVLGGDRLPPDSFGGGDLVRMAANARRLRAGGRRVFNLWMDDVLERPSTTLSSLAGFFAAAAAAADSHMGLNASDLGASLTDGHARLFAARKGDARARERDHITTTDPFAPDVIARKARLEGHLMGDPAVAAVLKAVRSTFACAHTTSVEPGWCTPPPANHSALNRVVRPMPVRGAAAVAHFAGVEAAGVLPHTVGYALNSCRSRACPHPYGHALGRALALLTTHGADRLHRMSALSLCGASFQLGCFHGAVEGSVLRRLVESEEARGRPVALDYARAVDGSPQPPHARARLAEAAGGRLHDEYASICAEAGMAGIAYGECVHALGHAAFMLSSDDLGGAERACRDFAAAGGAASGSRLYYCAQGAYMEAFYGGVSRGADFCRRAAAPGPCFAYWWPSARVPNVRPAARDGKLKALDYCAGGATADGGGAAFLGCVYGAAASSSHGLTPRSPACDAAPLVRALGDWIDAAKAHAAARGAAWANSAAAERLESVVVDGFVRRGGKYFPGCQREMCASLPRALAPVCGAVVSEGMYPGPVARTPEFGVYVS